MKIPVRILKFLSLSLLITLCGNFVSNAYVLNSKRIYNPNDVLFWIQGITPNRSEVINAIYQWGSVPEITIWKEIPTAGGADIMIEYISSNNGDTYAVSKGGGHIVVYNLWSTLNSTQRKETIVHEVGHEAGLAHTQSSNDAISVMRQYGFNNKPYPLSDDKAGISILY